MVMRSTKCGAPVCGPLRHSLFLICLCKRCECVTEPLWRCRKWRVHAEGGGGGGGRKRGDGYVTSQAARQESTLINRTTRCLCVDFIGGACIWPVATFHRIPEKIINVFYRRKNTASLTHSSYILQ
ncbi:hypothetical protein BD410DRAFT_284675 [Rickenella mellea]|uniref:Uncharacterized protein n=1 Tax=Rickenella mellea TaxID=50990 RepID=A0A4Y7Q3T6_9AGAM|nr:hypothetical protein BD410DRAFT_284675 [Rickenella mellea]